MIELQQPAAHQEVSEPDGQIGETSRGRVCWTRGGQREGEGRRLTIFLWVDTQSRKCTHTDAWAEHMVSSGVKMVLFKGGEKKRGSASQALTATARYNLYDLNNYHFKGGTTFFLRLFSEVESLHPSYPITKPLYTDLKKQKQNTNKLLMSISSQGQNTQSPSWLEQ